MSWIGTGNTGTSIGQGGNPEIAPVDRHHTLGKLQQFLLEFLGNSPDAASRSSEMAVKFEDHVFKSTHTKEDYIQTINARMKFVQAKKNQEMQSQPAEPQQEPPYPEPNRAEVYQKMEQFRNLLPRMEKLIEMHGRMGTNPELIRKYAGYKNVIQRQLELLPSNTFIMPLPVISNLLDQSTKMTLYLATKAKELLDGHADVQRPYGVVASPLQGTPAPSKLSRSGSIEKHAPKQQRRSIETIQGPPPSRQPGLSDIFRYEPDLKLVEYELAALKMEFPHAALVITGTEAGVLEIAGQRGADSFRLALPLDYPSTAAPIVSGVESPPVPFALPATLTASIRSILCK